MKLVVATPYPEGSTLAVARAAAGTGSLTALYTSGSASLKFRGWSGAFGMDRYIRGRELPGIAPDLIRHRADGPELAQAVLAHIPGMQRLGSRTMYAAKMAFDRAVARDLRSSDAVLGIYASAAVTFHAARSLGALTVLNFVNSHPVEHNRYLRELASVQRTSPEFVPDAVVRRVDQELSLADLVLVPSTFVAQQLLERGLPRHRVAVIPYGVDLRAFSPAMTRSPSALVRCVYVGQISHRKGIPVLLRAANMLPGVQFILTGPVVTPSLLRRVPRNVRWMGPLPHRDVARLMREADIFVLPSVEDSYGLVVLEAMACGLPVVVTDHVGASEVVVPGLNGLVVPAGDHTPLVAALRMLASDPDLRFRMGRSARERVSASHSWTQYGAQVLTTIDRLLEGRAATCT